MSRAIVIWRSGIKMRLRIFLYEFLGGFMEKVGFHSEQRCRKITRLTMS